MNNKKSKALKIAISIIAIIVLVVCFSLVTKKAYSNGKGKIEVEVVDINGTKIKEKSIAFNEGDAIEDLIQENFENVVYKNNMIMEIEGLKTPEDWSTFICIYLNDKMSMVALSEIEFSNGDKISFIETEVEY